MIRQRRRGEWNDLSSPPSLGGSSGDKEWNECQTFDKKVQVRGNVNRVNTIIFLFFHVASVLVVAVGIVWTWRDLYTSQECDMTWSRREFLEIELPVLNWHGVRVPKYKLFKFMDQRDPRHSSFLSRQRSISIEDKSWCLQQQVQNIPIVLYIPGHFGSYEQSRSLGAHGLQLTGRTSDNTVEKRILQKLNDLTTNKSTMSAMNISTDSKSIPADIADFFYDVFAVDFGEEGGAFHGALLERQSFFIAQVVQSLARTCGLEEIHIVAHSIGGVSARLASSTYKTEMMSVRNIVTLGTPHAAGVLSWDPSMSSVYNRLNAQSGIPTDQALLVSISGGLRDEMIPPRLCNAGPAANRLSLLSTQIMRPAAVEGKDSPPNLGMDHRAVVWCHNLLSEVRVILFILSTTTDYSDVESRATLLTHSLLGHDKLSHSDFNEAILQLRTNLKTQYGTLNGFAMETALLYNADILVQLYACIGTWRYSGHFPAKVYSNSNALFIWLAPIGTFLLVSLSQRITHHSDGNNMMDMSYLSLLVLVLTADGIFLLVRSILTVLARIIPPRQQNQSIILRWHRQWTFLLLLAGAMTSMAICGVQLGESWAWSRPQAVLSLLSIVAVYVVGLYLVTELPIDGNVTCSIFVERQIDFVTWIWLVVPFLSFGNLVMIPERLTAWTLPLSLLPIASRLAFTAAYTTSACSNGDEDIFSRKLPVWSSVNSVLRAVVAVLGCWRVAGAASSLYYGEDVLHPIAQLAVIFSIWDIAEMALIASRH